MLSTTIKKYISFFVGHLFFLFACPVFADSIRDIERRYDFTLAEPNELANFSSIGLTLNNLSYDLYYQGISPHLSPGIEPFVEPIWSAFWAFNFSMWPHEMGHWARAQQAGGDFNITGYRFPFPVAEMLPAENASPEQDVLTSSGGFEVNNMMRREITYRLYKNQYNYSDEMIHAFIQTVYFPFYSFVVAWSDPKKTNTWSDTYGDPVEYTLQVYENYTGRPAITNADTVDQELIDLYHEVVWINLAWTLLDPMLYQSALGFTTDMKFKRGIVTPWQFGDENLGWSYATQFNPSPLGYELHLFHHLLVNKKLYAINMHVGRPYKNVGAGIYIPELLQAGRFSINSSLDIWDQDIFGKGLAFAIEPSLQLTKHFYLAAELSWKSDGYILGRRLEEEFRVLGRLSVRY